MVGGSGGKSEIRRIGEGGCFFCLISHIYMTLKTWEQKQERLEREREKHAHKHTYSQRVKEGKEKERERKREREWESNCVATLPIWTAPIEKWGGGGGGGGERERDTVGLPVSKILCGHITNGQFGQHYLGPTLVDLVQLVVQDLPFCIYN